MPKKYTLSYPSSIVSDEGLEKLNRPLTFEDVWKMFQETDRQFKETRKQIDKTSRTVDHVSKMVGGMSNTRGEVTEDFFKAALKNTRSIAGINYTYRGTLHKENGIVSGQYDIVLFGKDAIIVVEVKHKLHPDDVDDFHERRLPKFKNLFPEYNDKKLVGALAGMTIDKVAAKKALSLGYILLTQDGQMIKVISSMED